jgi:uncharacterized protein (TIGR02145 family)
LTACAGSTVTLTASGGGSYCFTYGCSACGRNPYTTGNDAPTEYDCLFASDTCIFRADNSYTLTMPDSGVVTVCVRVVNAHGCVDSACVTIDVYPVFTAGAITTASGSVGGRTKPGITIANATPASGGDGNITYQWRRSGDGSPATLTGDAETYDIGNDTSNYETAGTYYINRYAKDETCNTEWEESTGTYTLTVSGVNQLQGGCTFTQPEVVGTFQTFDKDYSPATYVTLTDERDSNNYTVVKIGTRWMMAQNLNYQTAMTYQPNSAEPSTSSGSNTALIGHFWCPGGYGTTTTTSTRASCDVWGALYSWETAMMVDGKWTSSDHSSSSWMQTYDNWGTYTASGNTQNHGRSDAGGVTDGRGICPENWHVPTDKEWGDILDEMETGTKNHNDSINWRGQTAGSRAKSTCTCNDSVSGSDCVDDAKANWYYHDTNSGTDNYGFRVLPTGNRNYDGSDFNERGYTALFWSSSAYSPPWAWIRGFVYIEATVYREYTNRSCGFSVRCVRDE